MGEVINLNDDEIQQQGMLCKVTEQKNYESKMNEEVKNDIEKEEDYEDEKKKISLHVNLFLARNGVTQKVCMKLLK